MDKVLPALVMVTIVVVIFTAIVVGWTARRRRQSGLPALATPPADLGDARHTADLLYVATTRADAPTDRIAVRGLGFRAQTDLAVVPEGVVLALAGRPDAFIPAGDLVGVGRATWTIDRVVGRDRLVFVRWRLGDIEVDSYFRPADPDALVAALESLLPAEKGAA